MIARRSLRPAREHCSEHHSDERHEYNHTGDETQALSAAQTVEPVLEPCPEPACLCGPAMPMTSRARTRLARTGIVRTGIAHISLTGGSLKARLTSPKVPDVERHMGDPPALPVVDGRCHYVAVLAIPAGLVDGRKLARSLQVSGGGPWFLAARGCIERVGAGDLSLADLKAVEAELGDRVFVAMPRLRSLQEYLTGQAPGQRRTHGAISVFGPARRLQRFEELRDSAPPTLTATARGAQVAVLPELGPVWVDGYRLFRPGEKARLPWTDPRVELTVVRPSTVRSALREVIGRSRATKRR